MSTIRVAPGVQRMELGEVAGRRAVKTFAVELRYPPRGGCIVRRSAESRKGVRERRALARAVDITVRREDLFDERRA